MGSFKPDAFVAKLAAMNSTQASIETVSNWCQFYRKQAPAVVGCWDSEFVRAPPPRRLLMLYLANDILQNSRKKGPDFQAAFFTVLPRALKHAMKHFDDTARGKVNRLVSVWDERKVFGNSGARTIKDLLADAETPRKRSLSARTGGGGDFSHGGSEAGPATPRSGGGAGVPREVQPVADACVRAAGTAHTVAALEQRCSRFLGQEILEQGSPAELREAAEVLREYSGALAAQGGSLDACITALQRLSSQQAEVQGRVTEAEARAGGQLAAISDRLARLEGAARAVSPTAPPFEALEALEAPLPSTHGAENGASSDIGVAPNVTEAGVPPLPAAVAQPLPALGGSEPLQLVPGASVQQELGPQQGAAPSGPGEDTSFPPPEQDADRMDVDNSLLNDPKFPAMPDFRQSAEQHEGTGIDEGAQEGTPPPGAAGDDEAAAAAAKLVAQLSAGSDASALLEALAALPQDQQREISMNFLNFPAAGGSVPVVAPQPAAGEDEEYDPEEPGF